MEKMVIEINKDLIYDYIKKNKLTTKALCRECGFSLATFKNILVGRALAKNYVKLLNVIGCNFRDIILSVRIG